jgi:competence ComEA-like helix-hairpin-helix protein
MVLAALAFLPIDFLGAEKKEWITLENCQLVSNPDNDGDSFHIKSNDTEYLVRLYLVDAPETKGGLMAARLVEQSTYFGLTVPQVIEVGKRAKQFVDSELSQPFTVETRMAQGLGRSKIERFYGFVQTKDGDLGQLLVANGLARVHGKGVARPGAKSANEEIGKLQELEQKAKDAKIGGWDPNVGAAGSSTKPMQTIIPAPSVPASTAKLPVIPAPPTAQRAQAPQAAASSPVAAQGPKLDVNTATKEQLEKIPGVGDSLSERIIAARPFKSADDLKKVKGIGEGKRYEQIRPYFE